MPRKNLATAIWQPCYPNWFWIWAAVRASLAALRPFWQTQSWRQWSLEHGMYHGITMTLLRVTVCLLWQFWHFPNHLRINKNPWLQWQKLRYSDTFFTILCSKSQYFAIILEYFSRICFQCFPEEVSWWLVSQENSIITNVMLLNANQHFEDFG